MTRIESVKYIIWGSNQTPDISDTEISNLIQSFGYNGSIRYIATSQLLKLSQNPTSINDGANSFGFDSPINALKEIIKMAEKCQFLDPEAVDLGDEVKRYFTLDMNPKKCKDYWGR